MCIPARALTLWKGATSTAADLYARMRGRLSVLSANEGFFNRLSAVNQLRGSFSTAIRVSVQGRAEVRLGRGYAYSHDTGILAPPDDRHLQAKGPNTVPALVTILCAPNTPARSLLNKS